MSPYVAVIVFVLIAVAAGFYAYAVGREPRKRSWWVHRWPYAVTFAALTAVWVLMHVADRQTLVSYCAARNGHLEYVQGVGDVCVIGAQT